MAEENDKSIENDLTENGVNTPESSDGQSDQRYGINYTPGQSGYSNYTYGNYPGGNSDPKKDKKRKKSKSSNGSVGIVIAIVAVCLVIVMAMGLTGTYMVVRTVTDFITELGQPTEQPGQSGGDTVGGVQTPTSGGNVVIYKSSNDTPSATDFTETVEKVKKSVVEINTETVIYQQFYGNYIQSGAGSGVIIGTSEDKKVYYIVTNHHVVDSANTILVRLYDGSEYSATFVASDEISDIAVLSIAANGDEELSVAEFADSSKLRDGQDIFAIGNPLGQLGGSVIKGIISKTERHISVSGIYMSLLQIDASVNPGNSGGGLFDMAGNLVGIVNAKSSGDNVDGLGFAIPINTAMNVVEELLSNGYVSGRLGFGVELADYTASNVTYAVVSDANGVTGTYTDKNGKTQTFTFAENDFIMKVGDTDVSGAASLISVLSSYAAGDTVQLTVYRIKQTSGWGYSSVSTTYQVTVTLQEYH